MFLTKTGGGGLCAALNGDHKVKTTTVTKATKGESFNSIHYHEHASDCSPGPLGRWEWELSLILR